MNIGIATFIWADNYGALLQAYALQEFLQTRGHSVQIIDFRIQKPGTLLKKWISISLHSLVRKWQANRKEYLFEKFRTKYLNLTPERFYFPDDLSVLADRYDVLIAGSDQIWNPRWLAPCPGLDELYFLSFAGSNTRCISYAASFGHADRSSMDQDWCEKFAQKVTKFHSISVREFTGNALVKELSGRTDAVKVADPTILLDSGHFESLAGSRNNKKKGQYLFSLMLHCLDNDATLICNKLTRNLKVKQISCDSFRCGLHRGFTLPDPTGWLRYIRDAKIVVTNSFHGVVFCLIFHTPFIAVLIDGDIGSMNVRIIELLDEVGLQDRVFLPGAFLPEKFCIDQINWKDVDDRFDAMRRTSIRFIENCGL